MVVFEFHDFLPVPSAPVKLSAKALNTTALQVTWEAAPSSLQSSFNCNSSTTDTYTCVTKEHKFCHCHLGRSQWLNPESVAALQKVEATAESITVNWTAPTSGNFSSYQLGINPTDSPQSIIQVPLHRTQHTFEGLKPGKNYTVAIRTIIGQTNFGQIVRLQAVTKPLPVMDLKVNTVNSQSLNVRWAVNGTSEQNSFTVLQEKDGVSRSININASSGQIVYEVPLTQLLAGYTYSVTVIASRTIDTDLEDSEAVVTEGTTNPLPVRNLIVTVSSSMITVTWVPGINSRQDIYTIKYRPLLEKPDAVWLEQTAVTNATQFIAFPGEEYQLSVIAKSKFYSSDPTNASVIVAPLGPVLLLKKEQTTTSSVTVTWNYESSFTFTQMWSLRYYNTSSKWTSDMVNITRSNATTYSHVLSGLMPGVTYTVELVAVVKGVTSTPVQLNATAKPVINTVMNEIKKFTTQSQFAVQYTVTYTDVFDFFEFTLQNETDTSLVQKDKLNSNQTAVFSGLQSGRVYTVEAVTISSKVRSDPISMQIVTVPVEVEVSFESKAETISVQLGKQKDFATGYRVFCTTPSTSSCGNFDSPSAVNSFKAVENGFRSVLLSWMPPSHLNGHLRQYIVEYSGSHPSGGQVCEHMSACPCSQSLSYSYIYLMPRALACLGKCFFFTGSFTEVTKPLFKAGMTRETGKPVPPAEGSAMTENTISVQLNNVFSDDNGPVVAYAVIVSLDSSQQDSRPVLPSWKDTQDDSSHVVYQATSNCSDLFHSHSSCGKSSSRHVRAVSDVDFVVFTVGSQSAEECKALKFCNGPLKAGTDYYIKLRAFTAAGFTDTAYSAKVKTVDSAKSSAVTVAVVVVILILVTVVVAVVVTFFVVRHKRRPKKATKYRPAHSSRPFSEGANLKRFSRPVRLVDFPEHVQRMGADSDFKYAEEYEDLKEVGRDQPCYAAELPANRPKNRFTNILPYDHSRVKLLPTDDEEGSDYINANYMPGYNSKREYIATQGPLPATRDDFWRMVWEQNSCNIVMLTRCMEKGREKSDHYWPTDSEPKYYGDLQVVVLHETHLPDWTITEFRVCHGDSCRQIRHFHYKAWPDFGVPKHHTSLIRFVRTVRDKLIKDGGPIVTHCSAGVGRSGTFIVLDHVLQLIKEKEEVDIFNIVYNLRRERVLMVQTEYSVVEDEMLTQ
ncbi:hypothetical protein C0Q70_11204 [Pomacea canaliculata]|uniref:protein-tyrosine-phosphatase n=1 Tax=Pomacea canaliculata TaxID=400727 RepID=A0A2T7P5C3_POMCA|nr:hypothetical protein C0Q70_11204 [Pomacea canaliculata]